MQSYDHYGQGGAGDDQDDDYSPPSSSSRDPKAADKSKADVKPSSVDKGDRKGVINRVNRACNNCRRMKMRCVGAEDPPCKRCRNGGLECVMEKPGRTAGDGVGEDRIRSLESQVTSIQNTLSDLVHTLRQGMSTSSAASNGSGHTPGAGTTTTPEYAASQGFAPSTLMAGTSPQGAPVQRPSTFHPATALASQPRFSTPGATPPGFIPPTQAGTFNPYANTSAMMTQTPADSPLSTGTPGIRGHQFPHDGGFRRPLPAAGSTPGQWQPFPPQPAQSDRHMSLPPSRAGSEGPDDILAPEDIINPLGTMSNMAGLVEAAVERARQEQRAAPIHVQPPGPPGQKREAEQQDEGQPQKKARFSDHISPKPPAVVEAQGLPQTLAPPKPKSKVKKTHVHAYPDVVDEGYVSEEEARELMGLYYTGSCNFLPCYDPTFDTWESLKIRSPFSITCITMVGARVRDGGGPVGDVQRLCREHAQRVAMGTMFNPVARIEAVQAMSILAAFSDNGWLPGGHAVRMALDMGINKSFIKLLRSGMGKGKTPEELEEERPLVVHSRVWFCLYLMEHQMAYGMGRPAILREDESIHQCRRLLEHPLSITSDARLISTVELTALRAPLHVELTAAPDLPIDQNTLKRLKQANHEFDSWERYWDRILAERFGKGRGDFYRESLGIQRQYAELFVNSQLLRGIREPSDVLNMPEEKRTLAIRAMRNAQHCLEICLRRENYRNSLRYAVHYTHVCAAFAASFLIRIARLFPQELNLKKTAKDVEELAGVLSEIPAGRYARSLRLILRRARRAKVIPAASVMHSPSRTPAPLPQVGGTGATSTPAVAPSPATVPAFSPTSLVNSAYMATPGQSHHSPGNLLLSAASQVLEESPQSTHEISEFDFLFAQENLERSGLQLGEGDPLPLFLDGHSLGGSLAATDAAPFVGLENFFLPADVDNRLAGGNNPDGNGLGDVPSGDLWW